jgi:hypothetical protein
MNTKSLEDKIKDIDSKEAQNIIKSASDVLGAEVAIEQLDFLKLKSDVNEQSKSTIKNIAELFFDFNKLSKEAKVMVESRMELDIISLESIIYQIKTSDYATTQILRELNMGLTSKTAKLFELFNTMQKTNIDSIKTLSSLTSILENQYANLKKSIDEISITREVTCIEGGDETGRIKRGTKDLLKDISDLDAEILKLNPPKDE